MRFHRFLLDSLIISDSLTTSEAEADGGAIGAAAQELKVLPGALSSLAACFSVYVSVLSAFKGVKVKYTMA